MIGDPNAHLLADKQRVERLLDQILVCPALPGVTGELIPAMRYAVLNGGKRIRAGLCYAVGRLGIPRITRSCMPLLDRLAMAVELFHAYSLVHDDLPAMDNDDWRRGQPSCHRAYGESTAILVGDALQSLGFELLSQPLPAEAELSDPARMLHVIHMLAQAIGRQGMVGGQDQDMAATGQAIGLADVVAIHQLKTGALLEACAVCAAHTVSLEPQICAAVAAFSRQMGLAFQILNDLLEKVPAERPAVEKDIWITTRTSDQKNGKFTYPDHVGIPAAQQKVMQLYTAACACLSDLGDQAQFLQAWADQILSSAPGAGSGDWLRQEGNQDRNQDKDGIP